MPKLLKKRALVEDRWLRLGPGEEPPTCADTPLLVPLETWRSHRGTLASRRPEHLGVWLDGDAEPAELEADLQRFACVAVRFPSFTDGRGFSCARLLREQQGYQGELRAIGDIFPDQLHYLQRCGFDSFELADDVPLDTALRCLDAFSTSYQKTGTEPH